MGRTFGMWLKKARQAAGVSQIALAEALTVKQPVVSRLENGLRARLTRSQVEIIAAMVQRPSEEALEAAGLLGPRKRQAELESFGAEVDARPFVYALSNVATASAGLSRLPDAAAPGADIRPGGPVRAIRIAGDCMEPLLKDGDVALVLPPDNVRDGDAVLALLDGGTAACKRIRITPDSCWLESGSGDRISEAHFLTIGVVAHKITEV